LEPASYSEDGQISKPLRVANTTPQKVVAYLAIFVEKEYTHSSMSFFCPEGSFKYLPPKAIIIVSAGGRDHYY